MTSTKSHQSASRCISSANYVDSPLSEAASAFGCGQDEDFEDEEECTSTQESLGDQLACRWQQTRASGVTGKSSAVTSPPTQSGGAESVFAGDHAAACGDADFDSDDMDSDDDVELIPERVSALCAQQATSSRFRGAVWNVYSHKWVARIISQGVVKTLGRFDDKEAAAQACDEAAVERGLLDRRNFDDYELPETVSGSSAPQRESSRFQLVSWHKTSKK
jgi:hypothetical protein